MCKFMLPLKIKSQNASFYKKNGFWVARADKKRWLNALAIIAKRALHPAAGKRKVTIVSYRKRLLDYGNLVGGAKPILDALKKLGWIVDDSPAWVIEEYKQFAVGQEFTEIFIEEA